MGGSLSCRKTQAMKKETLINEVSKESVITILIESEYSISANSTEGAKAEAEPNSCCLESVLFSFLTKVRIVPFF